MKKFFTLLVMVAVSCSAFAINLDDNVSVTAGLYSRYVWRGSDFGNAPVIQPGIDYSTDNFSIGAWGSYSLSANTGGTEADLYASYTFGDLFTLSFTDYFFPDESSSIGTYFDYDTHSLEFGGSFALGDVTLSGYYLANQNDDLYFEASYSKGWFGAFVGAGDNSYTAEGDFNLCNVGISASKDCEITDKLAIPVTAQLVLNPDKEQIHFVFGINF